MREYAGKTVAVLGASGFLGAHVVARLVPLAKRVIAFARGTATSALPSLAGSELLLGDITNARHVALAVQDADVVFMLAGRSGALASLSEPAEDLAVNCGGLLNVLHSLRQRGRQARVIFPGSRLQYGTPSSLPVHEDAPLQPLVPYGVHKGFCEEYLAYFSRFEISYAVVRFTNPFGPAHVWPFRGYNVLNLMISKALRGEALPVFGSGKQLRDYLYVSDAVDLLLLAGSLQENLILNGGSGSGISLADVASKIVALCGKGRVEFVPWPPALEAIETGDFVADIGRATALGWSPRISLNEGLRLTVEEMRASR